MYASDSTKNQRSQAWSDAVFWDRNIMPVSAFRSMFAKLYGSATTA